MVSGVKFTWISGSKGQNCVFQKNLKYFWQLNTGIKIASKYLHVTQNASIQTWVLISNIAVIFKQKCSSLGLFFSSCKQFRSRLLSKFKWEVWPFIKPNWKTVRLYIFRTITIWTKLGKKSYTTRVSARCWEIKVWIKSWECCNIDKRAALLPLNNRSYQLLRLYHQLESHMLFFIPFKSCFYWASLPLVVQRRVKVRNQCVFNFVKWNYLTI